MPVDRLCVIGGSAGGLEALRKIYDQLPPNLDFPVVVVLHLHRSMQVIDYGIVISNRHRIQEAEDKMPLEAATTYVAPANYHLLIERHQSFALNADDHVQFSRPSIDVAFRSAAKAFENNLLAIVLTGANSDGGIGAGFVEASGGRVLIQKPEECDYPEMPEAALEHTMNASILDLESIAQEINHFRSQ